MTSPTRINHRARKRTHMLMWAMLTLPIREDWSWRYLLEWAALGGREDRWKEYR